jgi:hypothetical protein
MPYQFKPGDCVIYRKQKYSTHPGPKANSIWPTPCGEYYSYCVDKFYRVTSIHSDQTVVVVTRRGRQRTLGANDPALRRARFWERLLHRHRFPPLPAPPHG